MSTNAYNIFSGLISHSGLMLGCFGSVKLTFRFWKFLERYSKSVDYPIVYCHITIKVGKK